MRFIKVVYHNPAQIERLKRLYNNTDDEINYFVDDNTVISYIYSATRQGKREATKLKSFYAAKLEPFVAVEDKVKPLKAFYSEAMSDVIGELIKYLENERNNSSNSEQINEQFT